MHVAKVAFNAVLFTPDGRAEFRRGGSRAWPSLVAAGATSVTSADDPTDPGQCGSVFRVRAPQPGLVMPPARV